MSKKSQKLASPFYFLTKGPSFITLVLSMVALLSALESMAIHKIQKQQEMAIIDMGQNTELSTFNLPKYRKLTTLKSTLRVSISVTFPKRRSITNKASMTGASEK